MINQKKIILLTKKLVRIKRPMPRSDLCNFSDVYIVVKGTITVTNPDNAKRNKPVAFQINAPFINYISKINGVQIDNPEDLDVVAKITEKEQVVCGIIREMKQVILFRLILNPLNTKRVLQEILMFVMVKMIMM